MRGPLPCSAPVANFAPLPFLWPLPCLYHPLCKAYSFLPAHIALPSIMQRAGTIACRPPPIHPSWPLHISARWLLGLACANHHNHPVVRKPSRSVARQACTVVQRLQGGLHRQSRVLPKASRSRQTALRAPGWRTAVRPARCSAPAPAGRAAPPTAPAAAAAPPLLPWGPAHPQPPPGRHPSRRPPAAAAPQAGCRAAGAAGQLLRPLRWLRRRCVAGSCPCCSRLPLRLCCRSAASATAAVGCRLHCRAPAALLVPPQSSEGQSVGPRGSGPAVLLKMVRPALPEAGGERGRGWPPASAATGGQAGGQGCWVGKQTSSARDAGWCGKPVLLCCHLFQAMRNQAKCNTSRTSTAHAAGMQRVQGSRAQRAHQPRPHLRWQADLLRLEASHFAHGAPPLDLHSAQGPCWRVACCPCCGGPCCCSRAAAGSAGWAAHSSAGRPRQAEQERRGAAFGYEGQRRNVAAAEQASSGRAAGGWWAQWSQPAWWAQHAV